MTTSFFFPLNQQTSIITEQVQTQLQQIDNWLSQTKQKKVTLREMKLAFPEWQTIEIEMGNFVDSGFFYRQNGGYTMSIPKIKTKHFMELIKIGKEQAQQIIMSLSAATKATIALDFIVPLVVADWRRKRDPLTVYCLPLTDYYFYDISIGKSEHYSFCEINSPTTINKGLASYFNKEWDTSAKNKLSQKIGDVRPSYFLEMSGNLLSLIASGQSMPKQKANIFLASLIELGYLKNESESVTLTCLLKDINQEKMLAQQSRVTQLIENTLEQNNLAYSDILEKQLVEAIMLNELIHLISHTKSIVMLKN